MEDFELMFDVKKFQFVDEETGFVLHAEDVMMHDNGVVRDLILAGTMVKVDDLFIEVLRDTVDSMYPDNTPW